MSFGGGSSGSSRISTSADVLLNNAATNDALVYNASTNLWQNKPTGSALADASIAEAKLATSVQTKLNAVGGGSQKSWEDAHRAIVATTPSSQSQLTAIAADANTDDAPRLQAMLNYIKTTYGGGRLFVPVGKTSNCNSTITIPAGVQVVGSQTSRWDFWFGGSAIKAVVVNDNDFTPINGLKITGNQYDANASSHNTTTSIGLDITGHGLNFIDVQIGGFNWGIDCTNDNTFIVAFERSAIIGCMVAINLDLSNAWSGGSGGVNNSGERMVFTDCVIANCGTGYWATGNGVGLYFTHVSIDFTTLFGRQQNAHVFFSNCHLETTGSSYNPAYLFDLTANPRLYMENCGFITGAAGVYSVINPANGPYNYGTGMAHFSNCYAQYTMTSAASSANAIGVAFSESVVVVPQNATTVTVAAFFVTKWNLIKVHSAVQDGNTGSKAVTPSISGMSSSNGTVTITLDAPAPAGTFLEVSF